MDATERLSASLEDYVEAIYRIEARQGAARVKDIAESLDVAMPSVTGALKALVAKELVNYKPYSVTTLTAQGTVIAREVTKRHEIMARFLKDVLGLDASVAERNACRLEHATSRKTFERIKEFTDNYNSKSGMR